MPETKPIAPSPASLGRPPVSSRAAPAVGSAAAPPPGPKLNLGCGPIQPEGWVNIDGSNRARLASQLWPLDRLLVRLGVLSPTEFGPQVKIHDLRKPLPYADNSVSCIYAGELWEHFEYPDAARLTRECHRVLAPGGVLRLCVPDGAAFWERYLEIYRGEMAKDRSARSGKALREQVALYFHDIATRRIVLGSIGHVHKWQFDEVQLVEMVEQAGFDQVERKDFCESRIPDVDKVERWAALMVEAVKA